MSIYTGSDCLKSEEFKIAISNSDFYKDLIKIVYKLNNYNSQLNFNLSFHIYCKYSGLLPKHATVFNLDSYNQNILNESRLNSGYILGSSFEYNKANLSSNHYE